MAREAKVSVATVSRVLNKSGAVKEATRKRVIDVMERMNYSPNVVARSLKTSKSHTVGVMIPDITNPYFSELIRGIEDAAKRNNYNIILANTDMDRQREEEIFDVLKQKRIDGVVFASKMIDDTIAHVMRKINIPIVLTSTYTDKLDFPTVGVDNEKAAFDMVEHLIGLGHVSIGMISGFLGDFNSGYPRYAGYKKAMECHGLSVREQWVDYGEYKEEDGKRIAKQWIKCGNLPTAIFCASDMMAIGAMNAFIEEGYRIPQDISIAGFDNIKMASYVPFGLTTLAQPIHAIGDKSLEVLIGLLEGKPIKEHKIILPHTIMVRGSVASKKQ